MKFSLHEVLRKEKGLCICCMEEHEIQYVRFKESTTYNDVPVEFEVECFYCDKAEEYYEEEGMLNKNMLAMKDAYRKATKLLTSSEIIDIRSKYNISQTNLSNVLGWGGKTITRYESHAVQDMAHDLILRKIDSDPAWFIEILDTGKERLTEAAYKRCRTYATGVYESMQDAYLRKSILASYACYDATSDYCGGMALNLDKIVDVVRYFANSAQVTSLYKVKLMKLLWYADALAYKRTGRTITGLVYKALPMGAVPVAYDLLIDLKGICYEEEEFPEGSGYHFIKDGSQEYPALSTEETEILNAVIAVCGNDSKVQIVERMHKERAYQETKRGEEISFRYAVDLSIN